MRELRWSSPQTTMRWEVQQGKLPRIRELEVSEVRPDSGQDDSQVAVRLGAFGHKPDCPCKVCAKIKLCRQQGKPTKKERAELSKAKLRPSDRVFAESIATQIVAGKRPNLLGSALAAGYSPNTAQNAADLARSPGVQRLVLKALEKHGITQEKLAQVAGEGLAATEIKAITYEGKITDRMETADHHARFKFWESLNRIMGNYPKEAPDVQAALIVKLPMDARPEDAEMALDAYFDSARDIDVTPLHRGDK